MKLPSLSDEELKLLGDVEKIIYKKLKELEDRQSSGDVHAL